MVIVQGAYETPITNRSLDLVAAVRIVEACALCAMACVVVAPWIIFGGVDPPPIPHEFQFASRCRVCGLDACRLHDRARTCCNLTL